MRVESREVGFWLVAKKKKGVLCYFGEAGKNKKMIPPGVWGRGCAI